jgi:hypothetical protein
MMPVPLGPNLEILTAGMLVLLVTTRSARFLFCLIILQCINIIITTQKKTPWPQSTSELYRPSERGLSAKLVPIFADRGCLVVSAADSHGRILGFLYRIIATHKQLKL